jgi:hypothetical protein
MNIDAISPISPVLPEHTSPGGTGQHAAPGFDHQIRHSEPHKVARSSGPADTEIDAVQIVDRIA